MLFWGIIIPLVFEHFEGTDKAWCAWIGHRRLPPVFGRAQGALQTNHESLW